MTSSPSLSSPRASRHRASSVIRLAIATALLVPTLAACAPDPAPVETGVPTTSSASAVLGACMRDAGFDVTDEHFANTGVVAPPQGVDVDAYVAAFSDCREGLPADQGGGSQGPTADDLAALQEANLDVARCVREKGFDDFPDPVDGEFPMGATSTSTDPDANDPQMDAYLACDKSVGPNGSERGE